MRHMIRLDWNNGRDECVAFFRADYHSALSLIRHTIGVHGMEDIPVAVTLRGVTWEGTVDEDAELVAFLLKHW